MNPGEETAPIIISIITAQLRNHHTDLMRWRRESYMREEEQGEIEWKREAESKD